MYSGHIYQGILFIVMLALTIFLYKELKIDNIIMPDIYSKNADTTLETQEDELSKLWNEVNEIIKKQIESEK